MTLAFSFLGLPFGSGNYWDLHGVFLLGFLTFFPRLALLFSSIPFGGHTHNTICKFFHPITICIYNKIVAVIIIGIAIIKWILILYKILWQ